MTDSSTRKLITDKLGAEVFDHCALEEIGSVAWECPSHLGYHLNAESSFVEFLRDGEPVPSGEPGEVHVTSFYQLATPIIRYCTGDVATPVDSECSCGRGLPTVKGIQGRILDFVWTTDGRQISPLAIVAALESAYGVEQYKVIQHKDLSIELLLKTNAERVEPILDDLRTRCTGLFGNNPFQIRMVDRIDRKGPKFRLVESHRND